MTGPVDLTNLRTMTDGDAELEKSLFEEFFISFEKELAALGDSMGAQDVPAWHAHSHALKGISLNLGAQKLGELCKIAQDEENAPASFKSELLEKIKAEYDVVKRFLLDIIATG
ncbi:MAG TPA: Hpt domain-containing protein [Rickettsiales bacterium]|nr:Hpt domain-containing protein [Rickettsiales bacterium]